MLPFTSRLRLAIASAEALASGEQRRDVSPSDLLAGILSLGGGLAVGVLRARGFTESDAAPPASDQSTLADTPTSYTAEALTALSGAMLEAVNRSNQLVGVEHMLVGILTQPSAEIWTLLAQRNIKREQLLSSLRAEM